MSHIPNSQDSASSAWWFEQQKSRPITNATQPFEVPVVGVTFDGRQSIVARLRQNDRLFLRRQPENRYDRNAVEVVTASGQSVGYLSRDLAASLAGRFSQIGDPVPAVVAAIVGDTGLGNHLGVRIRFELPVAGRAPGAAPSDGDIEAVDLDDE